MEEEKKVVEEQTGEVEVLEEATEEVEEVAE